MEPEGDKRKKVWLQKGKNLFNDTLIGGTFNNGIPTNSLSTTRIRNNLYIPVNSNSNYTISATYSKILQVMIMLYDKDKNFISTSSNDNGADSWNIMNYTFTTTSKTKYIMFVFKDSTDATISISDIINIQIEQNLEVTDYENYIRPKIYTKNDNDIYEEFMERREYLLEEEWTTATLNDGVSPSSNGLGGFKGIRYRKIGNHVFINGSISTQWQDGTQVLLTTLPEGYRPKLQVYTFSPLTSVNIVRMYIKTNGELFLEWVINLKDLALPTQLSWVQINIDYFID